MHKENTDNSSIRIHVNKRENRITFKTKTGYYLKFSTSERMTLLESTKSRPAKDENGENVTHLKLLK